VTSGISFHRPIAFWIGATFVTLGVLAHLPDYFAAGDMHFHMAGMPMSRVMIAGMFLVAAGMVLATWGLLAPTPPSAHRSATYQLRAIDDAALTSAHWGLLFVLGVALIIDVMKPATLGFILPGLRAEYGISTREAATLPFVALTGTTIGSLIWGILADRWLFAFWVFAAAGASDAVDGYIARRLNQRSPLGAVMDPLADKVLLVSIFVMLGLTGVIPTWLVWIVVGRDIAIVIPVIVSWQRGSCAFEGLLRISWLRRSLPRS